MTHAKAVKDRKEISSEDKWNVESLYPHIKAWNEEFTNICRPEKRPHWPEVLAYKGRLGEGVSVLKEFLNLCTTLDRRLSKLYTYAHLRFDEDVADDQNKKANILITNLCHEFQQEISWAEPEILALSDAVLTSYLKDPLLKEYHFYLERIVRMKPHTLSTESEELLALSGQALGTSSKVFGAFNNADLKFPQIADKEGKLHELTHGKYLFYLRSNDQTLRKNAFEAMQNSFLAYENSVCEMLNGQVQKHLFNMRARNYSSCVEAALFPNQIDTSVYETLIKTVNSHLAPLHRYMKLRKSVLKLPTLHMWDLHVPLVQQVDRSYDFDTAQEMVIASVKPLGGEYQKDLAEGLKKQRWVDRYENLRKRSGAYSSGCYDSMPYILMNFQGAFHDLMTLAHEVGHSMHSLLSHRHQPYQYSQYPIFLAEVASTFNEELLFHYLMQQNITKEEKIFLLNQKLEDIRSTLFRQTMFAEFELWIHKQAEENIPLTPALLKEKYHALNQTYFGSEVVIDSVIDIEWARIPHFYYNFYVYQYATGISAAHALFKRVMEEGEEARRAYLQFLSSGSKDFPLNLLKQAGVDMHKPDAVVSTIEHFDAVLNELFNLLK